MIRHIYGIKVFYFWYCISGCEFFVVNNTQIAVVLDRGLSLNFACQSWDIKKSFLCSLIWIFNHPVGILWTLLQILKHIHWSMVFWIGIVQIWLKQNLVLAFFKNILFKSFNLLFLTWWLTDVGTRLWLVIAIATNTFDWQLSF